MDSIKEELLKHNILVLRRLCSINRLESNYLRRINAVNVLITHYASIRIQRFFRKRHGNMNCLISFDLLYYPFYGFKTGNKFLYYNIEPLRDCLFTTGQFKDPTIFAEYTIDNIKDMDNIYTSFKQYIPMETLVDAYHNTEFYEQQRITNSKVSQIESLLDYEIIESLESGVLSRFYINEYEGLIQLSRPTAYTIIKRHIKWLEYIYNTEIDDFEKMENANMLINDLYDLDSQ